MAGINLERLPQLPIAFMNADHVREARLVNEVETALDALRALDGAGVDLLACVTCLEFFALTERIEVGTVSNMREIVQRTMAADKVVTV